MHHTKRQQLVAAISLGFMTVFLSVLQPIPPASAQLLTKPISQETDGTGTQGKRHGNIASDHRYPTNPIEKMDAQTSTRKSHRLIRKPQNLPLSSVESSLSGSSTVNSVPSSPLSQQRDGTISQTEEPSVLRKSVGAAIPLATISATPSTAAPTGFTATGTAPTGAIPLAAAGVGNSASSGRGAPGGRTMRRLSAEMSGFSQLVSPPSAPTLSDGPVTGRPAIGTSSSSLSFTAQQGGGNPAAQTLSLSNTGSGTLRWSASESTPWLLLSSASGTGNGSITVSAATGSLTVGTHSGTITLSGGAGVAAVTVPVSFTISAAPVAPAIGASPTTLSFTAQQGGGNPAAQTLSLSNTGGGTLSWNASESTTWLSLSPASGTGNGSMTTSVVTGSLAVGSHSGTITLSASGASSVTIPVTFTITAAPVPPAIGLSPTSLSFTAQQGSGNPAAQTLTISNTGGGTLNWNASESTTWLSLSPASGTGNGSMTASVVTGSLTAGSYSDVVTLSGGAGVTTVPVSFTVTAAPVPPAIGASPTSLAFTATQGGANPAAQTLSISNTGGGTLTWSASDNAAWLTLSPSTGTGNGTVALNAATGTLTPATYSGTITLSGGGVTPVTVPVSFTISATPAIGASPTTLSFTAQQGGGNPVAQTLTISNTGGGTLNWSVSHDATWLSHTPGTGTGTGTVTISVLTGFLTAGTYNGVVTLYATGAPSVTVPVAFTVTPSATTASTTINVNPSSLSYAATQGAANPTDQNILLTTTGGTVNWTVSDNDSWLAVNLTSGSGSRTLTASVNTVGLTAQTYTGTLTVSAPGTSSKTVAVTLTVNAPATSSTSLTWNANTESDLAGYNIYRAETSGGYGAPIATLSGNVTTYIAAGLQVGKTYYFVITAYDLAGNESPRSNEISKSIY